MVKGLLRSPALRQPSLSLITKDGGRRPGPFGEFVVICASSEAAAGWVVRSGQYVLYASAAAKESVVRVSLPAEIRPDGRVYCLENFGAATSFVKTLMKEGYPATVVSNRADTGMFVNDFGPGGEVGLWVEYEADDENEKQGSGRSMYASVRKPGMIESLEWVQGRRRRGLADKGSAGRCDGVTACSRPPVRSEPRGLSVSIRP